MDSAKGNHCNDIIVSPGNRLDERNQSSASNVMSNDSNDAQEDHVAQMTLLCDLDDDSESIDDACDVKNRINLVKDNDVMLSDDFMVQAKSMSTASTFDVSEFTSVPSIPFCDINEDANTGGETEIRCNDEMSTDDHVNNHELTWYYSNERIQQPEMCSTESSAPALRKLSLLDQLDIMFEKLCFADTAVCDDVAMTYACPSDTQKSPLTGPYINDFYLNSMDTILAILGCNSASSTNEYEYFASLDSHLLSCCDGSKSALVSNQILPQQQTHPIKMKVSRRGRTHKRRVIQQLLVERGRTSLEQEAPQRFRRTRSFSFAHGENSPHQEQQKRQGQPSSNSSTFDILGYFYLPKESKSQSLSRMLQDEDSMDGYDSDPCLPHSKPLIQRAISPRSVLVDSPQSPQWNSNKYWYNINLLRETIEITMNSTWDLIWIHNDKPIQVQVWIEPGTIIQNRSAMVEPCLMWRCLSSTMTHGTRNASMLSSTPNSLRLLQICRVRPVTTGSTSMISDKDVPSMCRMSTSFVIRSIYHNTFYFQASTIQERDSIVHQWKATIARLATLAVLEDTTSLIDEFFLDQRHNQHSFKV